METNVVDIAKALEAEKCSFHKYRAMVLVENGEFRIIGCCKSFENFLELKSQKMRKDLLFGMDKT
ncbi:MAG: hypothetical protein M3040_13560 [Bacteroidota bacterium]|nr:hypothetical protein [Bacteroidota bacterium]